MKWRKTIELKHLFKDYEQLDDNDDFPEELGAKIQDIIYIEPELEKFIEPLEFVQTVGDFNDWMTDLYNFCDVKGIWIQ